MYAVGEIDITIACVDARTSIKKNNFDEHFRAQTRHVNTNNQTLPEPTHSMCTTHTHKHSSHVHINHHTHACIPPNRSRLYNIMHTLTKHPTPARMSPATQPRFQQTARERKTWGTHMHSTPRSSANTCRIHASFLAVCMFLHVKYSNR